MHSLRRCPRWPRAPFVCDSWRTDDDDTLVQAAYDFEEIAEMAGFSAEEFIQHLISERGVDYFAQQYPVIAEVVVGSHIPVSALRATAWTASWQRWWPIIVSKVQTVLENPPAKVNSMRNPFIERGSGLNLIVRNRYDSEYIPPPITEPYVVISVYTPGDAQPNLAAHAYKVESLAIPFYDVPYEPGDVHAEVRKYLFSPADARAIVSFVESAKERGINTVVVHCDMGQSRSVAIAAALSLYYNDTVGEFKKGKYKQQVGGYGFRIYNPNLRVYRLMVDALFKR